MQLIINFFFFFFVGAMVCHLTEAGVGHGEKSWDWRRRVVLEEVSDNGVRSGDGGGRTAKQDSKENLGNLRLSRDRRKIRDRESVCACAR